MHSTFPSIPSDDRRPLYTILDASTLVSIFSFTLNKENVVAPTYDPQFLSWPNKHCSTKWTKERYCTSKYFVHMHLVSRIMNECTAYTTSYTHQKHGQHDMFEFSNQSWGNDARRKYTFIRLILSVNLVLNSKESVSLTALELGSLFKILYLAHDRECSNLMMSSSVRFNWPLMSV